MKKLKFYKTNTTYNYGYKELKDGKEILYIKFMIFKNTDTHKLFQLSIHGNQMFFKKLSTAKQVGILIYNG